MIDVKKLSQNAELCCNPPIACADYMITLNFKKAWEFLVLSSNEASYSSFFSKCISKLVIWQAFLCDGYKTTTLVCR